MYPRSKLSLCASRATILATTSSADKMGGSVAWPKTGEVEESRKTPIRTGVLIGQISKATFRATFSMHSNKIVAPLFSQAQIQPAIFPYEIAFF